MRLRRAFGVALITAACVGQPPPPPGQDGSTTGELGATTTHGSTHGSTHVDTSSATRDDTGPADTFGETCGDGIVEMSEECDLGGLNGTGMYCTEDCTTNICGDGYAGPGEGCDDGNQSNEDLCTTECGPTSCGDAVTQGAEQCDEGEDNSTTGACLPSCVMASCGDMFIHEGVESCDGNNTAGDDCQSQGFDGGELLCANDCTTFDTSNCYVCGDGNLNPGEQCEGTELDGETCMTQGFNAGTLACSPSCDFDASGCVSFTCGNGVIDGAEECDGNQLGGATCASVLGAGNGGTLVCEANCTFDTDLCCLNAGQSCMGMNALCCDGTCTSAGGTQC